MDIYLKIWKLLLYLFFKSFSFLLEQFQIEMLQKGDVDVDVDDVKSTTTSRRRRQRRRRRRRRRQQRGWSSECTILRIAPSRDDVAAHVDTQTHTRSHSHTRTQTHTRSHSHTHSLSHTHSHLLHLMPSNNPHALAADSRRHYHTCSTKKCIFRKRQLKGTKLVHSL